MLKYYLDSKNHFIYKINQDWYLKYENIIDRKLYIKTFINDEIKFTDGSILNLKLMTFCIRNPLLTYNLNTF